MPMQSMWAILSLISPAFSTAMCCRRLGTGESRSLNVLIYLVVYVLLFIIPVQLISALQLLGVIKAFSLLHIALLDLFILTGFWIGSRLINHSHQTTFVRSSFISFLKNLPKPVLGSFIIVTLCYLTFAIDLFTSYPQGPDGIYYRLPLAVRWLQEGSLRIPPHTWRYALPGNAEIPMMVLLGVGWQPLVLLFNLLGTLILAISTYLIALKCRVNKTAAFIASLIIVSVPLINFQTFLAYTEVYGSSFIIASIAIFLYRYEKQELITKKRFLIYLILSGLALGVAIGTKLAFLVYGFAIFVIVFVLLVRERYRHKISIPKLGGLFLIAILLPCIFWFARAFFTTGNPFYPLKVEILNHTIFDGYSIEFMRPKAQYHDFVQNPLEWFIYPWTEQNTRQFNYSERGGLGASFATFVPVGVLYTIFTLFKNRAGNEKKFLLTLFLFLCAGLVAFYLILSQVPRYSIPIMVLACVLAVPFIEKVVQSKYAWINLLLIVSFATTSIIAGFFPLKNLLGRIYRGEYTRAEIYHYPPIIDELPKGSTILNLGRLHLNNFALAGKHLSNKVIPVFMLPYYVTKRGYKDIRTINKAFLLQNKVDYICQIKGDHPLPGKDDDIINGIPYPKYLTPGIPLKLVYDEADEHPQVKYPWRIWKVVQSEDGNISVNFDNKNNNIIKSGKLPFDE